MSAAENVRREALELRDRAASLERIAGGLRDRAVELEDEARRLDGYDAAKPEADRLLRGRRIVDAFADVVPIGETVHYAELIRLLEAAGYVIAGGPDNVIAAISRDARWEAVGNRTGRYTRIA